MTVLAALEYLQIALDFQTDVLNRVEAAARQGIVSADLIAEKRRRARQVRICQAQVDRLLPRNW